jgi:hypothetical protein
MPLQTVYAFNCPNPKCPLYTVLPRESRLGKFDSQLNPSKGIWPIQYLCRSCNQPFEVQSEAIHPRPAESTNQSQLIQYVFSNGQPDSLVRIWIYCKESETYTLDRKTLEDIVHEVLSPSGFWRDEYGTPKYVDAESLRY